VSVVILNLILRGEGRRRMCSCFAYKATLTTNEYDLQVQNR
jgi:hypothetical protein